MTVKQRALRVLTKDELLPLGRHFELDVSARLSVDELVRRLSGSKRATLDKIAPTLAVERLREMCNALGLETFKAPCCGTSEQAYLLTLSGTNASCHAAS